MNRLFTAAIVLWLGGCATLPPALSPEVAREAWARHEQALAAVEDWALTARIAIRTHDDGWNGQLQWHQTPAAYQIFFTAPFGQGALRLEGDNQGVAMHDSEGGVYNAPDAESLLFERLGWRFPVRGLRYWVTGLPEPDRPRSVEYDHAGRLASLRQSDWRIRYTGYRRVDGVDLPEKVFIENHALSVRLVIDRWQLKPSA